MVIVKTVNNNVVISQNPVSGEELVLIGRGIGFQKKTGDEIDESKIQKQFHPAHHKNSDQYMALLEKIPFEYMRVADDIIAYAKCSLGKPLDEKIQVSLTDHLAFAIDRAKQGIVFKNALLWEIKRFYNHEFLIGKEAVAMVRQRLEVELSEDEAGFFALHIVNAVLDMDMGKSIQMTGMIEDIIKIVRYHFQIAMNDDSLTYERFLTHLKFFVQRAVTGRYYRTEDMELFMMVTKKYPQAYECALKICDYVEQKLHYRITEEELLYLTVHIERIREQETIS